MADQSLIQGAGAAAQSKFAGKLAGSRTAAGISSGISNITTGYFQKKAFEQKQYDVMAQKVLDEAGDLSPELKSEIYDELQQGRYDYVYGDKKGKMLSIENLNKKARTYAEFMDTRLELAELMEDEDALNNYFKNSGNYDDYLDLLKPNARLVNNEDGEAGYEIGGEWKSLSEIRNTIKKEGSRDEMFEEKLGKLMDNYTQMSSRVSEGQVMPFPQQAALNMIKKNLIGTSSNLNSIAYDDFFGGTSFYEDLVEGLQAGKYTDLGIEDPTGDTGITADDADIIAKELINNPDNKDLFVDEISKYYTGFLMQNWNDGKQFRMVPEENYTYRSGEFKQIDVLDDEDELASSGDGVTEGDWIVYKKQGIRVGIGPNAGEVERLQQGGAIKENTENYKANYTEMDSLSIQSTGVGEANILENGKPITMNVGPFGAVSIDGVKVSGTDIIVDSSMGDQGFGRFKLENNKYKWYPDTNEIAGKTAMQHFESEANAKQKAAFNTFIQAVENDPNYAQTLMKHMEGGEGVINAGTLAKG